MSIPALMMHLPTFSCTSPDAIIDSRETFLQACKYISGTWSKRLQTIYWDATTTFPEGVIDNIRQIQECSNDGETVADLPGLQHLCIDYIERTMEEEEINMHAEGSESSWEHARRMSFFRESRELLVFEVNSLSDISTICDD